MIILKNIYIENFKSFSKIDFNLNGKGIILITGHNEDSNAATSNGAGKSSFMDTLCWVLYGETTSGVSNNKLLKRESKGGIKGVLLGSIDNKELKIERFFKHRQFGDSLILTIDSSSYMADNKDETQRRIDKLFGINFEAFCNSYLFNCSSQVSFSGLTDSKQKGILESILNTERFSEYLKTTNKEVSYYEEILTTLTAEFNQLQVLNNQVTNSLKDVKQKHKTFEEKKQLELEALLEQGLKQEQIILDNKKELQELYVKQTDLQNKLEGCQKAYTIIKEESDKFEKIFSLTYLTDLETEIRTKEYALKDIFVSQKNISSALEYHNNILGFILNNTTCTYCEQPISEDKIVKQYLDCQNKITSLEEQKQELEISYSTSEEELEKIKKKHAEYKETYSFHKKNLSEINNSIREVLSSLNILSIEIKNKEYIEDLVNKYENLQSKKSGFEETINNLEGLISDYLQKQQTVEKNIRNTKNTIKDLEFFKTAFGSSGIQSLILDQILPVLDKKVNEYSAILSDGEIKITFNTQKTLADKKSVREKFNVQVENINGGDCYKSNSRGECKKVDICVLLALQYIAQQRLSNSLNIVFFDEIFESLDPEGVSRVIDLLKYISNDSTSIFVITHDISLASQFDRVLHVIKKNGESYLE